jgi:isopentenyl diphosphate isomerase/L-lactate dehydrogenase-like FMN-dependent dehydrogenase
MGRIESAWMQSPTRRRALAGLASLAAGAALAPRPVRGQRDPRPLSEHRRHPGLDEMVTAFDFEPLMFANVPLSTYDYTAHGDGSEFTLRRNRDAFEWVDLLPGKPAVAPSAVDLSSELLGLKLAYPILVAPSATQGPLHPDAEIGMRRGAIAASNTPMILSHNTSTPVERVATAGAGPLWWQYYPQMNPETGQEVLDRAQAAGCSAVVVTVDQTSSFYERTARDANLGGGARGGRGRGRGAAANPTGAARYRIGTNRLWYTWKMFEDIVAAVKVPVLIKGIVSSEDAELAIAHGARAIVVSNHGGRSMDYGPSTLEVLPEIVAVVKGRVPVLIDSGFRRGSDVLKALALGANGVLLGRATRWALAAFGAAGVQRVLEIVQQELVEAAATAGVRRLADANRSIIRTRFP